MATDPLAQLRDISTEPLPWAWPLSWQANLALALLVTLFIALGILLWKRHQQLKPLRSALDELNALPKQVDAATLSALVKRCALAYHPRSEVASLTGAAWVAWLAKFQKPNQQQQWQQLNEKQYQPNSVVALSEVKAMVSTTLTGLYKQGKAQEVGQC
ncbi:DUF4381 domain-containing protein [Ferrimonas aestuarii]|uniref:DUF4381 domain-containing protein n=1 Tax=Ferrimonas aestuarii TaxID=2569539 RepID=A0A4V5NY25_9GAMM|nr:DUF4381 domain-containing protein [Ferrimonas aestuarii]TKB55538.1 DUF4381 domain-containing protein [Ferrimonas aestuarii]